MDVNMKTIYKYKIPEFEGELKLPKGAKILTTQVKDDEGMCIWALVDTDNSLEERKVIINGTGWKLDDIMKDKISYIATIQQEGYVWHVIEVNPPI